MLRALIAIVLLLVAYSSAQSYWQSRSQIAVVTNITCAQGTTFLARTTGLDAAHQTAYQNTICHLVNDSIITGNLTGAAGGCGSLLDAFYLMATADATTAALNICGTSYSLVAKWSACVHGRWRLDRRECLDDSVPGHPIHVKHGDHSKLHSEFIASVGMEPVQCPADQHHILPRQPVHWSA